MENTQILIVLQPTFSNELDKEDYSIEVEYGDLQPEVQSEVLDYFESQDFIVDQVQEYVLKDIGCTETDCYKKQLVYNGFVRTVQFELVGKILTVYVLAELILTHYPLHTTSKLTLKDLTFQLKDGFWKASHSGPLTPEWGTYLGEAEPRYMIYLDRVWVFPN